MEHYNRKVESFSYCAINRASVISKRSRPGSWSKCVTVRTLQTGARLQNIKNGEHLYFCFEVFFTA